MNVKNCMNGRKGMYHCIYKVRRMNPETKEPTNYGCIKHEIGIEGTTGKDTYNLYPEHNISTGETVYQQTTGEPNCFRTGPMLIWENISGHGQNGLNWDLRDFAADIHPLYHREERNLPSLSKMTENDTGTIFGESNPVLVNSSWNTEKWVGLNNVDVCNDAIYGKYEEGLDMIVPKCFKNYHRDIYDWFNFTTDNDNVKRKQHYLSAMTNEQISLFCDSIFGEGEVSKRLNDALLYIKTGNFLNIRTLMNNNFVSENTQDLFMDQISLRSKKDLYKGRINLQNYCYLYNFIDNIRHKQVIKSNDDKEIKETIFLSKEYVKLFKQNLINFILNYPELHNAIYTGEKLDTKKRYWFIIPLLKRAKKEGILNGKKILPSWLVKQIKLTNEPSFSVNNEDFNYSTAPINVKNDYLDSVLLKLDTPEKLYPGMIKIKDIIEDHSEHSLGWYIFCDILNAGKIWNVAEIRLAWEYFKQGWMQEDPSIFWNWIEAVADLPYETSMSISLEEHNAIIDKVNGRRMNTPDLPEIMEQGACDFNLGSGNISHGRAFALNLAQQFTEYESWDVQKQPISNNYDARVKLKQRRECSHETFWTQLGKMGGLKEDREQAIKRLSNDTYKEVFINDYDNTHEETSANMHEGLSNLDNVEELGLGDSDIYMHESLNPLTGERNHLAWGEGSWSD